jgi:hypothetical protein
MIKIYQVFIAEYESQTYGDCVRACLESILEKPLNLLNFYSTFGKNRCWVEAVNKDLAEVGHKMERYPGYVIKLNQYGIDYYTNDNDMNHVVVSYNGKIVHDPSDKCYIRLYKPKPDDVERSIKWKHIISKQPKARFYLEKI